MTTCLYNQTQQFLNVQSCIYHKVSHYYLSNTYGLLTKCEVKMAGYWPSSFLVHKLTNKERGQHPAILTEYN